MLLDVCIRGNALYCPTMKKTLFAVAILLPWHLLPAPKSSASRLPDRADVGTSGYEKLVGTIYFAVDPAHPRNSVVVDLDKAKKDGQGLRRVLRRPLHLQPKDLRGAMASRWSRYRTAAARDF